MEFRQLFKDDKTLMYQLTYKTNIKLITAKVTRENKIQVFAPNYISLEDVDKFILDHFERFYEFIQNRKQNALIDLSSNTLGLNGKKYSIKVVKTTGRIKYEVLGDRVYFHLQDESQKEKLLKKFYEDKGNQYLLKRADLITKQYKIAIPARFVTKWYEAKWGQCNIKTKEIALANQLIMFNDEIIDYVIIHELCHLIHPNHSPHFWSLVSQHYPKYEWAREKLKFQC